MDRVKNLLKIGVVAIKDKVIVLQRAADPDGDLSSLQLWESIINFGWKRMLKRMLQAVWNSAHARYVDWYKGKGNPKRKGSSSSFRMKKKARMN
jgi:hypothetical protein